MIEVKFYFFHTLPGNRYKFIILVKCSGLHRSAGYKCSTECLVASVFLFFYVECGHVLGEKQNKKLYCRKVSIVVVIII